MELIIVWYLSLLLIDVSCLLIIHYVTVLTGANCLGMVYPCKHELIDPMCKHINLVPRLQKAGVEPGNEAMSTQLTTQVKSMKSKQWATSKCMHTAN